MFPTSKDIEGNLSSSCLIIKDIQTCVIIKKTVFPINPENHQNKQDLVDPSYCTNEKSTCPLSLMSFAQQNIRIKVLKAMRKEQRQ